MFYREANKTHTATTQENETNQLVDITVQNQAATSPDTWQLISAASCCTRSSWQLKQAHVCTKTVASAHDWTVERLTAAIKKNIYAGMESPSTQMRRQFITSRQGGLLSP
jgi:hypothetical protein